MKINDENHIFSMGKAFYASIVLLSPTMMFIVSFINNYFGRAIIIAQCLTSAFVC